MRGLLRGVGRDGGTQLAKNERKMEIINLTGHKEITRDEISRALRIASYGDEWDGRTSLRIEVVINRETGFFKVCGMNSHAIVAKYRYGGHIYQIEAAHDMVRILQRY